MFTQRKLLLPILVFALLVFSGIFGYMVIEDWTLLDSFYMTVITLSTVGYGEVHEIGPGGRICTAMLIFFGLFIITYIVGLVAETLVEGKIRSIFGRRKLGKKIRSLSDHYIICGYGRIGRIICNELTRGSLPLVVIEKDKEVWQQLEQDKHLFLDMDATIEETLRDAGIENARGLVSVLSSDVENVYVCLTARGLNSELYILSRAEDEGTEKKLLQAGANKVILPYMIGGRRMAQAIVRPTVSDFLETAVHDHSHELHIEEIVVGEGSRLRNLTLVESDIRKEMDIIIIGIKQRDGMMIFNPSSETRIQAGDILIAMGKNRDLEKLLKILASSMETVSG